MFLEKNYSSDYYETLINMLNKSFLSLNLTNKSISSNLSFINLLKNLGLKDSEIAIVFEDFQVKIQKKKVDNKQIIINKIEKEEEKLSNYNLNVNYNININFNSESINNSKNNITNTKKFLESENDLIKATKSNLLPQVNKLKELNEKLNIEHDPLFISIAQKKRTILMNQNLYLVNHL